MAVALLHESAFDAVAAQTGPRESDVPPQDRRSEVRLSAEDASWLRGARLKYGPEVRVIDVSSGGILVESDGSPLEPAPTSSSSCRDRRARSSCPRACSAVKRSRTHRSRNIRPRARSSARCRSRRLPRSPRTRRHRDHAEGRAFTRVGACLVAARGRAVSQRPTRTRIHQRLSSVEAAPAPDTRGRRRRADLRARVATQSRVLRARLLPAIRRGSIRTTSRRRHMAGRSKSPSRTARSCSAQPSPIAATAPDSSCIPRTPVEQHARLRLAPRATLPSTSGSVLRTQPRPATRVARARHTFTHTAHLPITTARTNRCAVAYSSNRL